MKQTKSDHGKQLTAEEWVTLARTYGEDCVKVQRDSSLSADQKIEKQEAFSKEIIKKIQSDEHLSLSDKNQMAESIQSYMDEWKRLSGMMRGTSCGEKNPKHHQKH